MTEPCVIRGDFTNFKLVQGRKVAQLVVEIPIEEAQAALTKLGMPIPGESRWVAVALLNEGGDSSSQSERQTRNLEVVGATPAPSPTKDHRKFSDLPLSQQAGIRADERDFQDYLSSKPEFFDYAHLDPAEKVRRICGVTSRSKLIRNTDGGDKWEQLEIGYQAYLTDRMYGAARHG